MREELRDRIDKVVTTCVVDDVKIQGPVEQRALVHDWLVTRAKQWGYELNTQPGKTIVIKGTEKWAIVDGLNGRKRQKTATPAVQVSQIEKQRVQKKAVFAEWLKRFKQRGDEESEKRDRLECAAKMAMIEERTKDANANTTLPKLDTTGRKRNRKLIRGTASNNTAAVSSAKKGRTLVFAHRRGGS